MKTSYRVIRFKVGTRWHHQLSRFQLRAGQALVERTPATVEGSPKQITAILTAMCEALDKPALYVAEFNRDELD